MSEIAEMAVQETQETAILRTQIATRRAQVEARIETCRDSAAGNLLEIGRQLNAAKNEGLVPHGQWTAWVAKHAAMDERTAQRWMRYARELPPGSPLESLGVAKLDSLFALPAGEREAFAEEIGADKLTSREVDAKVKALKAERDEALRLVGEQKKRLQEAQEDKQSAVTDAIARTRADFTREKQEELARMDSIAKSAEKGRKQTEKLLDEARVRIGQLRHQLETQKANTAQTEEVEHLQAELKKKESEIDRLTDELDAAQTAAMRGAMAGEGEKRNPATTILSAIGALMAEAGRAPGELSRMQGALDPETRALLAAQARLTGQWAMNVLAACGEGDAYA